MKRLLSAALLLVLATLLLTGCFLGQKAIQNIEVKGLKTEYEIGDTPDYSGVTATVVYNDGTTKDVDGSELTFGNLDTSVAGKKNLNVTYEDFTVSIQITVKDKSIDVGTRDISEIEYFSGIPATVYVGDNINFDQIKIIVKYTDGTEETKDIATNANIKHNGDQINTSVAGTKTLTITFMGKSVDVAIEVNEIVLTGIEIDGDTVDTTIIEGTNFDATGMVVYAVYNNGVRLQLALSDLTIAQEGNNVTVSYQGKSAQLTLSTEAPTVLSMSIISTGYEDTNNSIALGDKFNTVGVKATAVLNNGTTKTISNSELVFSTLDINGAGQYTVTATYVHDESIKASFEITVLGISAIVIDTTTVSIRHPAGSEYNANNLSVLITLSNGSKVERSVADGVTVDLSNLDTENTNNTSYITASYGGVTSSQLNITVHDPDISYFIVDVDMPASLSGLTAKKDLFLNKGYGYVVGDDNPFIFKLDLTIINDAGTLVDGYSQYTSYFEVYLGDVLLEGSELDQYVAIDGKNNSIDFTEAAIGKTFTIKTRPLHGVDGREADMTRSLTVEVVDGLNIYEAWELNYLTNMDEFDFVGKAGINQTQTQIVDAFLATKGATRPTGLAGIVLHNDLVIKTTDIPAEYFVGGTRQGALWDYLTVFPHVNDNADKTFTFHGNYFTIFSYNIPNVCANGTGNQDDMVSNSQLFRFTANAVGGDYDHTQYKTYLKNFYLRDDNPNSDNIMSANRDMLGIIGMKVCYQDVFVENIRIEAFYISFFVEPDYVTANVNESIFYNAWQNHIYIYSNNTLQSGSETPRDNYPAATLNVTNSSITKCGGPVIIAQTADPDKLDGSKSGAQVNLDENTEIWTYVTGQEAWFKAMNATTIAQQVQQMGYLLQGNLGTTYLTDTNETGVPSSGTVYLNIVMVNLSSGTNVADVIAGTDDLDGKFTVGGTVYLDMTDTNTATHAGTGGTIGYGNANVAHLIGGYAGQAPVFNTAVGGVAVFDGTNLITDLTADATINAQNKAAMTMGDYIALYQNNMGIVLGYGHTIAMPSLAK